MYGPPQAMPQMPPGRPAVPPPGGADPQSALLMALMGGGQPGGGLPVPQVADFSHDPLAQLAAPPATPGAVAPPMSLENPGAMGMPGAMPEGMPTGPGDPAGADDLMQLLFGGPRPPTGGGPAAPPAMPMR